MKLQLKVPVQGELFSPGIYIDHRADLNLPGLGDDFPLNVGSDLLIGKVIKEERGLLTIEFTSPLARQKLSNRLDKFIYPNVAPGHHEHTDCGDLVIYSLSILGGYPAPEKGDYESGY